jgi:hypothetical protein
MEQRASSTIQAAYLYRGMQASAPNGATPLLGNDAGFELGVRDGEFQLNPMLLVEPGSGGMSTSNTAAGVPNFTVSRSYNGGSHNTANQNQQAFRWKWRFDDANLPAKLTTRNDHGTHVMIEAAEELLPEEFRRLIQGTQAQWVRLAPP